MTKSQLRFRYLLVGLGLVAALFWAWSVATRNGWICSWNLSSYVSTGGFEVRIPRSKEQEFIRLIEGFSNEHRLQFFIDRYEAGTAGINHKVNSVQIFGCEASIYIANNWSPEIYAVRTSAGPKYEQEGKLLSSAFAEQVNNDYDILNK